MAYTTIDDPSAHFQTALYFGNASTLSVTFDGNSDMQPDLVWIKARAGKSHALHDSSRGAGERISSDSGAAEVTASSSVTSFDSDGFSLGSNNTENDSESYVSWNWKANGGTTSSNTDGSLTSTVQANTDAGFSIVTYSNPGTANNTIGHGLGVQPEVIIFKNLGTTDDWHVASKYLTNYTTYGLTLNTDVAQGIYTNAMNATEPTSSVFSIGGVGRTGSNGNEVVAYCFASKQGFSKFGKYTGNGNANGPYIYTGFKPAMLILKKINGAENWYILDTKRDEYNIVYKRLFPNLSLTEYVNLDILDIYSNGFKIKTSSTVVNSNGTSYLYMAFAENPFVTSTGIPTTAR